MAENPSGIRFPFRFADAGGVRRVDGADKVAANLEALAVTALQERLVRKSVGTVGYQTVLRNPDEISLRATRDLIREAIAKYERRARVLSLELSAVNTDSGTAVFIDCEFLFRQTGEKSTFRAQIA